MNNGFTTETLLSRLPPVLAKDKRTHALATVMANRFVKLIKELEKVKIYVNIDKLPEQVLDILAYDFKVDWYDTNYSLEEKQRIIKTAWSVYRKLGTKAAVQEAIRTIYPEAEVLEWFEYNGDPYFFKVQIDAQHRIIDPEKHARVMEKLKLYKNVRSVLDVVEYINMKGTAMIYGFTKPYDYGVRVQSIIKE